MEETTYEAPTCEELLYQKHKILAELRAVGITKVSFSYLGKDGDTTIDRKVLRAGNERVFNLAIERLIVPFIHTWLDTYQGGYASTPLNDGIGGEGSLHIDVVKEEVIFKHVNYEVSAHRDIMPI